MRIVSDVKGSWGSVYEIWNSYWKLYGGWRALVLSPYLHVAILVTAICYSFWSKPGWWDTAISVAPTFLGFSLAGLAAFFSMNDEGFKRLIIYRDDGDASSPFLDVVVAFVHFVVWQAMTLVFALIAKSLFFEWKGAPEFFVDLLPYMNFLGWGVGFLLLVYSSLLLLAATFSIFRVARWYEGHITNSVNSDSDG